jgi:hypothetical protein
MVGGFPWAINGTCVDELSTLDRQRKLSADAVYECGVFWCVVKCGARGRLGERGFGGLDSSHWNVDGEAVFDFKEFNLIKQAQIH